VHEKDENRCGAGARGAALSAVVKGYADGETAKWVLDLFGDDPGREPVMMIPVNLDPKP